MRAAAAFSKVDPRDWFNGKGLAFSVSDFSAHPSEECHYAGRTGFARVGQLASQSQPVSNALPNAVVTEGSSRGDPEAESLSADEPMEASTERCADTQDSMHR